MANVQVKLNIGGVNKIMRSTGAQEVVNAVGQRIAAAAGEGFEYVARPHRWTARGYVQPKTARAMREQAKNAVLERALAQVQGA